MKASLRTAKTENPIRMLEELSLNAWPSLQTVQDDGWMLRFAGGYTRRSNSVNVLYPSSGDLDAKIRRCEQWYSARGLPTVFKMTPQALPKELDAALTRHHYKELSGASVQTRSLENLETPASEMVSLLPEVSEEWLAQFCRMRDLDVRYLDPMRQIIRSIAPAKCCAVLYREGLPVAVGLAVVERGYVGLFDITVDNTIRNQGIGRQLVLYMLQWGKANGATNSYLQVAPGNDPALHLYEKLGFTEVYQYWYREKQPT
jgi:N-acetylglutamate synthase